MLIPDMEVVVKSSDFRERGPSWRAITAIARRGRRGEINVMAAACRAYASRNDSADSRVQLEMRHVEFGLQRKRKMSATESTKRNPRSASRSEIDERHFAFREFGEV